MQNPLITLGKTIHMKDPFHPHLIPLHRPLLPIQMVCA